MNPFRRYFDWLQQDNPTGTVERYPAITEQSETSLPGVFVAGDLTGMPLLRLAADGGASLVRQFIADPKFMKTRGSMPDVQDVIIIGGGPAGIAAAMECAEHGLQYTLIEAAARFNTIENFPKAKPIIITPTDHGASLLVLQDGTKETLLADLISQADQCALNVREHCRVESLTRGENGIEITTASGDTFRAWRVILAIGKTGNARRLDVPGETNTHVFDKLYDPAAFSDQDILVVGGGDSAVEASIALVRAGNRVTHSYRKDTLSRAKETNTAAFDEAVQAGGIIPEYNSTVAEITRDTVHLDTPSGAKKIRAESVFILIGRELPLDFFRRSGIRMAGETGARYWGRLVCMVSFFVMLYFGKSAPARAVLSSVEGFGAKARALFTAPFSVHASELGWSLQDSRWLETLEFYLAWCGAMVFLLSGLYALGQIFYDHRRNLGSPWAIFKNAYLIASAGLFLWVYVYYSLSPLENQQGWREGPTYFYSLMYCLTMAVFGLRRCYVRRTRYVYWQTTVLVFVQAFFLFLLPFHWFDFLIADRFAADGYVMTQIFPNGKWAVFSLVLVWPLTMWQFGTTTFWTWFPFVQWAILFWTIRHYGKGIYCGWICSCGGLAETLGDEYRHLAPHGARAKRWENVGQIILAFALLTTTILYLDKHGMLTNYPLVAATIKSSYKILIDVIFAGVLGLGVYFFMGGRVWCRFGCPLAALMHIMTRFSRYRILSEKKKCISCNICTKVCHMGIDVMGYASRGVPLNDAECVRCSACVSSCPMEVLAFGEIAQADTENRSREARPEYSKDDWRAGIR